MSNDRGLLQPESEDLSADDVAALRALRDAKAQGSAEPGVTERTALRLDALGLIKSKVVPGMMTGGYEITAQGIERLAGTDRE
jgi:hypothetical protein